MEKSIKILSTKIISEDLLQQAKANNILIDAINFIETKPLNDIAVVEKIKQYAGENITVIFTSENAVEIVFSKINIKPNWKIFCTSGTTKHALLNYIDESVIVGTAHNASTLADIILENTTINFCIFFCGNQRLNTLPDKLLNNAVNLEEIIVYETISSPKKLEETYKGILFFSPSAVESFFSVNKITSDIVLFSVGKTTTKAVRKFTNNTIVTAHFPSAESVVKEVRDFDFES